MGQESKGDMLLKLIAVSGEMPSDWVGYAVGSDSYGAALITRLKQQGLISLRNKDGVKGYVLKKKAKQDLLESCPENFELYLSGFVETNHVKSEPDKRLRLHRMSMVWVYLFIAGVRIYRLDKPEFFSPMFHLLPSKPEESGVTGKGKTKEGAYYGTLEFKREMAKEIGGSRACGVLLTPEVPLIVYNTMNTLMKWAKKTERTMRSRMDTAFRNMGYRVSSSAVVFGLEMEMLLRLLQSDGGVKGNLFMVDDIYENICYIPLIKEAQIQVRLLMEPEDRKKLHKFLCEALKKRYVDNDSLAVGSDHEGKEVYFCYELDLWMLRRVKRKLDRGERGGIFCFDYQGSVLGTYFGKLAEVKGIVLEKAERYLETNRS